MPAPYVHGEEAITYVYDDLNRLVQAQYSDRILQYTYDTLGNRETKGVQQGVCVYSIWPVTRYFPSQGGTGTITVTAGVSCPWTASSDESWITITSGASGTGNGTASYTVDQYTGTGIRTGTISVAGQTSSVIQMDVPYVITLYASFTGYGLYKYDGSSWTQINGNIPNIIATSGSTLYASFTSYGVYKWDGSTWTNINTTTSTLMAASGSTLYASFPSYGLYKYDGSSWTQINGNIPNIIAASGSTLYASFPSYGLYKYDGSSWTQINNVLPASMVAGD
ncbi:MAG: BACON domain-containing protein [Syntrophorhabdaceae bacterium]|nr:BACON domain-containing protein [Syntrophorhabdaceae bacterium]